MKQRFLLPLMMFVLISAAFMTQAQTTTPAATQTQDQSQATDSADSSAQAAAQTTNEQPEDADASDEDAEDGTARFIPTEQVSQDLGVSFPVDI